MAVCVPIREMKNTAAFDDLVAREGEVTVTRNGRTSIHCFSDEAMEAMRLELAKGKLLSRIMLAEEELREGRYSDCATFTEDIRRKYGL